MRSFVVGMCITLAIAGGLYSSPRTAPVADAIDKGAKWLVSVQGADGGWGQDGGETSYIRATEHIESNGNNVANTAVAALALLQAGKQYQPNVDRAIDFILARVEASPVDGLAITDSRGTQIQRKLGPYIDTFLTSMLLAQLDGTLSKPALNARVRKGLEKCVAKIERNQKSDGSWGEEFFSYLAPSLDVRLPRQADDGSFRNPNKMVKEDDPLVATTFALHVLAR